jgi:hypothetical protein
MVVLKIKVDVPVGTHPNWWGLLGMPEPWKWDEHFPENIHVEEVTAVELMS